MNEDNTSGILDVEQSLSDGQGASEVPEVTPTPEVIQLEGYGFTEPLPVVIVEEEQEEIEAYAMTGVYPGTISDQYLQYFEAQLNKLTFEYPTCDYVLWRSGQYVYSMAWGDLEIDGYGMITGEGCSILNISRENDLGGYNYYTEYLTDDVSVNTATLFAYSNLGDLPTLMKGGSIYEQAILGALCCSILLFLGSRIIDTVHKCYKRRRS